jgi:hypothetical protein
MYRTYIKTDPDPGVLKIYGFGTLLCNNKIFVPYILPVDEPLVVKKFYSVQYLKKIDCSSVFGRHFILI